MKIFLNILKWVIIVALVIQLTLTISLFSSGYDISSDRTFIVVRDIVVLLVLLGGVIFWKRKIR
ncbi:hypothetical protein [Emticicia sp. C21]|uniref:hypothetical protein n=1 Tax=Emticicia sp. C21 TaxID=2302915 RepID=UPI000E34863A|nr:hypothetical protein [Emticicia sp. C21]RFS17709.1 hypothetical protein D0T08_00185 [Emticicia sp. C21]